MEIIHPVFQYVNHWLREIDDYSLHSPYLFNLYTEVFRKAKLVPEDPEIEELREYYSKDQRIIGGKTFGAGSRLIPFRKRNLGWITRHGITSAKYSKLLLALVDYFKSEHILELGTSLGLNSLYLSKGRNVNKLVTFEGNQQLSEFARRNFEMSLRSWIQVITGDITDTLPKYLEQAEKIDFVFMDANHTANATRLYLSMMIPHLSDNAVVVIDDIYWSKGMTRSWQQICSNNLRKLCLDIYRMGILIRRKEAPEGYFKLAF